MFLKSLRLSTGRLFLALFLTLQVQAQEEYTIYLPAVISPYIEPRHGAGSTYDRCEDVQSLEWFYNWGVSPPLCDGIEAVPMIWDERFIGRELGGNSDWLMGFNEPEMEGQANLTPQEGAEYWAELEETYQGYSLTTPCVTSLSWLTKWWAINEPKVDAVCVHCYGAWGAKSSVSKCERFFESAIAWGKARGINKVWVSEFAHLPCWPEGDQGTVDFINGMLEYFDNTPEITRYAWFQTTYKGNEPWAFGEYCNTSLVDFETGEITIFGEAYK